mmetsp:Transcript_60415/g.99851  ORF Transcript_60415/g.99851 Transcript_60415/m.99851 type:complete len:233 (+) Transcript_60415:679-1377(+)
MGTPAQIGLWAAAASTLTTWSRNACVIRLSPRSLTVHPAARLIPLMSFTSKASLMPTFRRPPFRLFGLMGLTRSPNSTIFTANRITNGLLMTRVTHSTSCCSRRRHSGGCGCCGHCMGLSERLSTTMAPAAPSTRQWCRWNIMAEPPLNRGTSTTCHRGRVLLRGRPMYSPIRECSSVSLSGSRSSWTLMWSCTLIWSMGSSSHDSSFPCTTERKRGCCRKRRSVIKCTTSS